MTISFPANFNEAKYVAFATFSRLDLVLFFVIAFIANIDSLYKGAALSTAIQVSQMAVLVCLFCPRIVIMILWPAKNVDKYKTVPTSFRRSSYDTSAVLSTINNECAKTINEEQQ